MQCFVYSPLHVCRPRNRYVHVHRDTENSFIYIKTEKTFKNEQRSKDAAAKKRPNTSGVGKINGDVIHSCYRKSAVEHDGGV